MASRRWLIGIGAASFRRSIYLIRMASSRRPSLRAHLKPHHKLWLDWDGAFLMGPRYLHFLHAVDRAGTIRAAGGGGRGGFRTHLHFNPANERVLGAQGRSTPRVGGRPRGAPPP